MLGREFHSSFERQSKKRYRGVCEMAEQAEVDFNNELEINKSYFDTFNWLSDLPPDSPYFNGVDLAIKHDCYVRAARAVEIVYKKSWSTLY